MFIDGIKDDWPLEIDEINIGANGQYAYRSEIYVSTLAYKMRWVLNKIEENYGKIIIISDIDILFYKKCNEILLNLINGHDILFQSDLLNERHINGGFLVVRCNEKTINLFKKGLEFNPLDFINVDQDIIQKCLDENLIEGLKWDLLPHSFYADSLNMRPDLTFSEEMAFYKPDEIYMHHANGPIYLPDGYTTLDFKIKKLKDMQRIYQ